MKIITNDYSCGTSSSLLDYNIKDFVVVCSEQDHKHIFDLQDDLFFVGHDFMLYLWSTEKYIQHWANYKHDKIVWCFEKIDCIVPEWRAKSYYSLSQCQRFTDKFCASDEEDCRKYNIFWLPQWASRYFYDRHASVDRTEDKLLFSGQAGVIGYERRGALLRQILGDVDLKDKFYLCNTTRKFSWPEYVDNLLKHKVILAPFGNLVAYNTRTFEALTSGRWLLQQVDDRYKWHMELTKPYKNVSHFTTFEELKNILLNEDVEAHQDYDPTPQFNNNSLMERLKRIGFDI
jgi:hypothetical protein